MGFVDICRKIILGGKGKQKDLKWETCLVYDIESVEIKFKGEIKEVVVFLGFYFYFE